MKNEPLETGAELRLPRQSQYSAPFSTFEINLLFTSD